MNTYKRVLRTSLVTLGMLATISGATHAAAQTVTPEETARSVRKMLERLPYYGVFDFIVFRVDQRRCLPRRLQLRGTSQDGRGSRHETGERRRRSRQQD